MDDPLLATMAATNSSMPLTPPADQSSFQNLDASTKMPDTPMADQFEIYELESEQSEPTLDAQNSHLVTHAKVYAIAEKYVSPVVILRFSSFCLITRPCLLVPFHLRVQVCVCTCAAVRLVARRRAADKPRDLRHRRDLLQSIANAHVPSPSDLRLSNAHLPFALCIFSA
jgi:hypothetical protein